mmetsp:Transcript_71763/g.142291  ORF Transcript_71763/g.142291 Transcript_71763/m.142291 type:complete len:271 (+) Transcript_71763:519-1331(+)
MMVRAMKTTPILGAPDDGGGTSLEDGSPAASRGAAACLGGICAAATGAAALVAAAAASAAVVVAAAAASAGCGVESEAEAGPCLLPPLLPLLLPPVLTPPLRLCGAAAPQNAHALHLQNLQWFVEDVDLQKGEQASYVRSPFLPERHDLRPALETGGGAWAASVAAAAPAAVAAPAAALAALAALAARFFFVLFSRGCGDRPEDDACTAGVSPLLLATSARALQKPQSLHLQYLQWLDAFSALQKLAQARYGKSPGRSLLHAVLPPSAPT